MTTITIRFEDKLFKEIELRKGDLSKSEYCRTLIENSIRQNEDKTSTNQDGLLAANKAEIEHLRSENLRLLELLAREQAVSLQAQKLISEPGQKPWWQFWKK
jgi:hypothetical protein